MITVRPIDAPADLAAAFAIREKVFVEEQQVPREDEYDAYEDTARHYLGLRELEAEHVLETRLYDPRFS